MKKVINTSLTFIILLFLCNFSFAQQTPEGIIKKDYPCLYKIYEDSIAKQTAHYIFALDVSSMMKTNVREILPVAENFIRQIPDNDKISFVKKSATNESGIILNSQEINSSSRNDIIKFLYDNFGEDEIVGNGSDGYTMTQGIIDAIVEPNSGNLFFIFMFSDFEYWTHSGHFNKDYRDWDSLQLRLQPFLTGDNSKQIHPYAFFYPDLTPEAQRRGGVQNDYRSDLQKVFGLLHKYDGSTSLLQNILDQIRTRSSAYRMKLLVDADLLQHKLIEIKIEGNDVYAIIETNPLNSVTSLYAGYTLKDIIIPPAYEKYIIPYYTKSSNPNKVKIAEINRNYKPVLPIFKKLDIEISFSLFADYVCDGEQQKLYSYLDNTGHNPSMPITFKNVKLPEKKYCFWITHCWIAVLIIILIISWITCFLITKFKKITRIWQISVSWKDKNGKNNFQLQNFSNVKQFTVGSGDSLQNHLSIADANWKIRIYTKSNCPCKLWVKTGYYIHVEDGDLMEWEYPYGREPKILGYGKHYFISAPRKFKGGKMVIKHSNIKFELDIS